MIPNMPPLNIRRKVLVLCTGNSCRSQMAEALINHHLGEQWQAVSAGTEPADEVHPLALHVLAEIGVDHLGMPRHADHFRDFEPDLVITVCDDAAEKCPAWLGSGNRVHLPFTDPAKATGTQAEVLAVFRRVRDEIESELLGFLRGY